MPAIDIGFSQAKMAAIAPNMNATLSSKRFIEQDQMGDRRFSNLHPIKKRRLFDSSLFNLAQSTKNLDSDDNNDLTNLNWLQDSNLLKKFYSNTLDRSKSSLDVAAEQLISKESCNSPPQVGLVLSTLSTAKRSMPCRSHQYRKPPYSYSALIFMAIESSANKSMMVRDIYKWIVNNFPYFATAPSGWKNTIRHTLSLRKCFKKVDKCTSGAQSDQSGDSDLDSGDIKGGFWHVDNDYRPSLLQLVERVHHNVLPKLVTKRTEENIAHWDLGHLWSSTPLTRDMSNASPNWIDDPKNSSVISSGQRFIQVPVISSFPKHFVNPSHSFPLNTKARVSPWTSLNSEWKQAGDASYKVHLTIDKLYPMGLLSEEKSLHNSTPELKRTRNAVSVISVNKAPKVYAPVPIVVSLKTHLLHTETLSKNATGTKVNDKPSLQPVTSDRKCSNQGRYDTAQLTKPEPQSVPIVIPRNYSNEKTEFLKPNGHSERIEGGQKICHNESLVGRNLSNKFTAKIEFEDDDDELIRDGAEALLNFASGAFQLNRLIKQED